jgi:hypothetical protein
MQYKLTRLAHGLCSTASEIRDPNDIVLSGTLERGLTDNAGHPRIPVGEYRLRLRAIGESHFDGPYGALLGSYYHGMIELCDVPDRSFIEIHTANKWGQLLGCIAPGPAQRSGDGEFMIPGGLSTPSFKRVYIALSQAIRSGGATLLVEDHDLGQGAIV